MHACDAMPSARRFHVAEIWKFWIRDIDRKQPKKRKREKTTQNTIQQTTTPYYILHSYHVFWNRVLDLPWTTTGTIMWTACFEQLGSSFCLLARLASRDCSSAWPNGTRIYGPKWWRRDSVSTHFVFCIMRMQLQLLRSPRRLLLQFQRLHQSSRRRLGKCWPIREFFHWGFAIGFEEQIWLGSTEYSTTRSIRFWGCHRHGGIHLQQGIALVCYP